jgi:hypothetical protein
MGRYRDPYATGPVYVDEEPMLAGHWQKTEHNDMVPAGWRGTFRLASFEHQANVDPYVLYNQFGQIVYQWPEGVEPTCADLDRVCTAAMRGEL